MAFELEKLREFAARYTEAWCRHDAAGVAAHFAPHGKLTINGGKPAVGRVAIAELAQSFMTAFPDLCVVMEDVLVKENRVEYHWILTGTNNGPGASGKRVQISGFESWKMCADGLIEESLGSFDEAKYQRQRNG